MSLKANVPVMAGDEGSRDAANAIGHCLRAKWSHDDDPSVQLRDGRFKCQSFMGRTLQAESKARCSSHDTGRGHTCLRRSGVISSGLVPDMICSTMSGARKAREMRLLT